MTLLGVAIGFAGIVVLLIGPQRRCQRTGAVDAAGPRLRGAVVDGVVLRPRPAGGVGPVGRDHGADARRGRRDDRRRARRRRAPGRHHAALGPRRSSIWWWPARSPSAAYGYALAHLPISTVVTHQYVNPVVALALGALVLGESLAGARAGRRRPGRRRGVRDRAGRAPRRYGAVTRERSRARRRDPARDRDAERRPGRPEATAPDGTQCTLRLPHTPGFSTTPCARRSARHGRPARTWTVNRSDRAFVFSRIRTSAVPAVAPGVRRGDWPTARRRRGTGRPSRTAARSRRCACRPASSACRRRGRWSSGGCVVRPVIGAVSSRFSVRTRPSPRAPACGRCRRPRSSRPTAAATSRSGTSRDDAAADRADELRGGGRRGGRYREREQGEDGGDPAHPTTISRFRGQAEGSAQPSRASASADAVQVGHDRVGRGERDRPDRSSRRRPRAHPRPGPAAMPAGTSSSTRQSAGSAPSSSAARR